MSRRRPDCVTTHAPNVTQLGTLCKFASRRFECASSSATRGVSRMKPHSQTSARISGTNCANARPRCDAASFSEGVNSAAERTDPTGTNTGS